jgi:inhibitor of cysteine peptidase
VAANTVLSTNTAEVEATPMRATLALLAVCLCVAVLALAGCGGSDSTTHPAGDVTMRPADFGTGATLTVGQTMEILLDANPTTGYTWHCTWTPESGLSLIDSYVPTVPILEGSGGTQHFVISATQVGQYTVTVQYGRWWVGGERENPQTFIVTVLAP